MIESSGRSGPRRPRILWIATKRPSPPVDGGRLLVQQSLDALSDRGAVIELLAPPGAGRRSWLAALPVALRTGLPWPVARHLDPELSRRVAGTVVSFRPDLVHVEQVHALPQAEPALGAGVPGVLRAQNVESDLWRQASRGRVWEPLGGRLADRFGRWEGRAVARVDLTLALTAEDRGDLEAMAGGRGRVIQLPVPFPEELPPGSSFGGEPAISLLVGRGWRPTREGAEWFALRVWPSVRTRRPRARLHVFGEVDPSIEGEGIVRHPAPEDSRVAFPEDGILAVPLQVASGIRMKILEAWARGVPVVATPRAVRGLEGEEGREWVAREGAGELAEALVRLGDDAAARRRLREAGRARLRASHSPEEFASAYLEAASGLLSR